MRRDWTVRIASGVSSLAQDDWSAWYADEAEGWPYYRACEATGRMPMPVAAVEIRDAEGMLVAAPLFETRYSLDTPLQGSVAAFFAKAPKRVRSLTEWPMLVVGSTLTDRCHLAMRPSLPVDVQAQAIAGLIGAVEAEAKGRGAKLIAFKDLAGHERDAARGVLRQKGYTEVVSLPCAMLEIAFSTVDEYLASLSSSTRKDIRRKLRRARDVVIEHREDIEDIAEEIEALYAETRDRSQVRYGDFEGLPEGYFRGVARELKGSARFVLYRIDGVLAAFNLLFFEPGRVIDKFIGMRYPLARDYDLYVVSWMENIRICLARGARYLQTGQTAYREKLRFGSVLRSSSNFVRARNPMFNAFIGFAAPWIDFTRWDPDLRKLAEHKAA
ncbi:GNAT family N-acetyltransferase [Methylovirgula sp. 4M-Z18]|uniref:GNAT family N-acetyltransferase n=1 Tax=Methylovirgula sp. 4M-Z18 TaxID=2293567 RepID=UPI000E2E973A|nr:GNAT family N-acetyltransferase [Methylovirgula sp. 4M-Z18]RFB75555.1 GNAT family N-acetyltransferase [Methylovirgula sp. 4M-Z18]